MMMDLARFRSSSIVVLMIIESLITVTDGINYDDYSAVYRWDDRDCPFKIIKMTQYEKRLVIWDGIDFKVYCSYSFMGQNHANVVTSYRTCFKMLDYNITDCDTEFVYEAGVFTTSEYKDLKTNMGVMSEQGYHFPVHFSCNDEIPEVFCADEIMQFQIYTKNTTDSYARLEIYIEAGVSFSIAACVGIACGIAFIGVVGVVLLVKYQQHKRREGQVIKHTEQNLSQLNASGQALMGNPTAEVKQNNQMQPVAPQTTQTEQSNQVTANPQGGTDLTRTTNTNTSDG